MEKIAQEDVICTAGNDLRKARLVFAVAVSNVSLRDRVVNRSSKRAEGQVSVFLERLQQHLSCDVGVVGDLRDLASWCW